MNRKVTVYESVESTEFVPIKRKNDMRNKPIVWIGGWSDEAVEIRSLARSLRAGGVKAKATDTSPYVGHRELRVAKDDLKLAVAFLKEIGEGYIAESMTVEYP